MQEILFGLISQGLSRKQSIHNKYLRGGTATLRYFLSETFRRNRKKTFEHPACLPNISSK
jgi:hypothetical protein